MNIEFDAQKDAANIEKHGVSLAFGKKMFSDADHVVIASHRLIDGEDRFKVIGMAEEKLWTAVYIVRGSVFRFISVRRSNDGEERIYDRP